MSPTPLQIRAAVETLVGAGWTISGPASDRLALLSASRVAQLLDVSPATARKIMGELPKTVMLPGGDLRCRAAELEAWLDKHGRPVVTTEATR